MKCISLLSRRLVCVHYTQLAVSMSLPPAGPSRTMMMCLCVHVSLSMQILLSQHCKVPISEVLYTGRFDQTEAESSAGWLKEINKFEQHLQHHQQNSGHSSSNVDCQYCQQEQELQHQGSHSSSDRRHPPHHHEDSEAVKYGISSFVYHAQRPFHPGRLMDVALSQTWPGVLRSKGFFWLATRHDVMGLWQSAGGAWQGEPR